MICSTTVINFYFFAKKVKNYKQLLPMKLKIRTTVWLKNTNIP
jgi:hypothetical protein